MQTAHDKKKVESVIWSSVDDAISARFKSALVTTGIEAISEEAELRGNSDWGSSWTMAGELFQRRLLGRMVRSQKASLTSDLEVLTTIGAGVNAHLQLEPFGKIAVVVESAVQRYRCQGHVGPHQHLTGCVDADFIDVAQGGRLEN